LQLKKQGTNQAYKLANNHAVHYWFRHYVLLLLMFFVQCSYGQEVTKETNADDYTLSVVTEPWFPLNYMDKKGNITGSSTKLVKDILTHANIPYEINLYPWQRAFSYAKNHKDTLIYSIFRTPMREDLLHWICPITKSITPEVFKLSNRKDITINTIEDLTNYSINLTRGTFPHDYFIGKGMKEGVNLQITATNEPNLTMLLNNRVDLIVEAELSIIQILNELGLPKQTVEKVYTFDETNQTPICMALSKETPANIVEKIRQSHKALYPH
jgi:polar amino acid transport system substrate-binding protein